MTKNKKTLLNVLWLLFFIALSGMATFLVAFSINHSFDPWYVQLAKPIWFPAKWILGPVWFQAIFYAMIGVAGWLLWTQKKSAQKNVAVTLFFSQLFLDVAWACSFFYFRKPVLGLIDILLFLVVIMLAIRAAWLVSKPASCLLIPSFIWCLYALAMNAGIVYFL